MKRLTFAMLKKLKFRRRTKDNFVFVSRDTQEVSVDTGDIVITGKPQDIAVFMKEMAKINQHMGA